MIDNLINQCWCDYQKLKSMPCVLNDAIPILWFGNMEKYFNSKKRIITIGLNPSDKEFKDNDFDRNQVCLRFPKADKIKNQSILYPNDIKLYKDAMNEYFEIMPYKWFSQHEKALNCLDASYKLSTDYHSIALHIDIESSIPTDPTWGKICEKSKNIIRNVSNINFYEELIKILKPDVIIAALGEQYIKKTYQIDKHSKTDHNIIAENRKNNRIVSYIRPYSLNSGEYLIWVKNYRGTPFGGMNDKLIQSTLRQIAKFI